MSRGFVRTAFAAFLATAGSLIASASLEAGAMPIGCWYAEYGPDHGAWYSYFLWDIRDDGTIVMRSRICSRSHKGVTDDINHGTWRYAGDMLTFDWTGHGRVSTGCSRYKVIDSERDRWTYQSLCTRNTYAMVRVTPNSDLPACEVIS